MFHFDSLEDALEQLKADEGPDYAGFEDRGSFGGKVAYGYTWEKLFEERHSKGAGPFGGYNNAVTRLVAVFRHKNLPYDYALRFAKLWNDTQCDPPLPAGEFHQLFGEIWARLKGRDDEYSTDAIKGGDWEIKTAFDLATHCPDGLPWLIENVFLSAGLHFISAPPGGAKSWLLMELIRSLLQGSPYFDRECPKRPVLWIDEEMGFDIASHRFQLLQMPQLPGLTYLGRQGVKFDVPLTLHKICDLAEANPGLIVVIDTLIRIHDFEENDSKQMAKLYALLKKLMAVDATIICACHESGKVQFGPANNQVKHGRVRGSSEIIGMADMVYSVEKHEGYYRFVNIKNRLASDKDALQVAFQLLDHEDKNSPKGTRVELRYITESEAAKVAMTSQQQAVYNALDFDEARGLEAIIAKTQLDKQLILSALSALKIAGEVVEETINRALVYTKAPSGF